MLSLLARERNARLTISVFESPVAARSRRMTRASSLDSLIVRNSLSTAPPDRCHERREV
jgi:hypothetical protein